MDRFLYHVIICSIGGSLIGLGVSLNIVLISILGGCILYIGAILLSYTDKNISHE